jgi:uncharacterized DUF497 family protein
VDFDWGSGNLDKCLKHGLAQTEIEHFFRAGVRVSPDPKHSASETRFIAVGRTKAGRPAFVAFCWRDGKIRPISARYMHDREVRRSEECSEDDDR